MQEITDTIVAAIDRLHIYDADADTRPPPTARDWAAFFQALIQFASVLLPLLLPLFAETKTPK